MCQTNTSDKEVEDWNHREIDINSGLIHSFDNQLKHPITQIGIFVEKLAGTQKRMLDVGCGSSRYVHRFVDAGCEYTGIDFSERMIAISRKKYPLLRFFTMSYRTIEFEDASFDGIWCCCTLNFGKKSAVHQALTEFHRVLTPEGVGLILLPNFGRSEEKLAPYASTDGAILHYCGWHLEEFEEALVEAKFGRISTVLQPISRSMMFIAHK